MGINQYTVTNPFCWYFFSANHTVNLSPCYSTIPIDDVDAITDYVISTCAPIVREMFISRILQLLTKGQIDQKDESNESISESSTTNNPA